MALALLVTVVLQRRGPGWLGMVETCAVPLLLVRFLTVVADYLGCRSSVLFLPGQLRPFRALRHLIDASHPVSVQKHAGLLLWLPAFGRSSMVLLFA